MTAIIRHFPTSLVDLIRVGTARLAAMAGAVLALSAGTVAADVTYRPSRVAVEVGSWRVQGVVDEAGLVHSMLAVADADSLVGSNLSAVWYVRSGPQAWQAQSWRFASAADAVATISTDLGMAPESVQLWEFPGHDLVQGQPAVPSDYVDGVLADDPWLSVLALTDPESRSLIISILAAAGEPVAQVDFEQSTDALGCSLNAKLSSVAHGIEVAEATASPDLEEAASRCFEHLDGQCGVNALLAGSGVGVAFATTTAAGEIRPMDPTLPVGPPHWVAVECSPWADQRVFVQPPFGIGYWEACYWTRCCTFREQHRVVLRRRCLTRVWNPPMDPVTYSCEQTAVRQVTQTTTCCDERVDYDCRAIEDPIPPPDVWPSNGPDCVSDVHVVEAPPRSAKLVWTPACLGCP